MTEAFNTKDHTILLEKMDHDFGIGRLPSQLLKSYLSNRWQYTKLNNFKSEKV